MADTTKTNEAKISIKVIVDKVKKRVVYAEADHTFIDILFSFMTLPMGTIVRLLGKLDDKEFETLGSFNNLYQSLKNLPASYFATEECKSMLLNPRSLSYDLCSELKLNLDDTERIKLFVCLYRCGGLFTIYSNAKCKYCGRLMNHCLTNPMVTVGGGGGVFVSEIATFLVTDDLSVMPFTAASSIQLLTDLGITDMSHLEGRNIDMGREQILYLLKMAISLDSPFSRLVFGRSRYIWGLDGLSQGMAFNLCDVMKKEASASSKMLLEVSLQKSTGKVLFAEAKEDFIDFLFGFLSIPLATVIGTLMNGATYVKCMDNIFRSISNMSVGTYLKSQDMKDKLLKPHFGQAFTSKNKLFPLNGTVVPQFFCPTRVSTNDPYLLKDPIQKEEYLKQSGMFIVTDDLVITPSTSLSTMDTLNKAKVKLNDIEKHVLSIGLEEGLRILKASLLSKSTFGSIMEHHVKK